MSEGSIENQNDITNGISLEKRADILQSSFEHYYKMAMDHHSKAGTTSNLLLIIVGALVALVGHDGEICGTVDAMGGIGITITGLFGAVWVLKQHERYYFWQLIAKKYHENMADIVPNFITGEKYDTEYAQYKSELKYGFIAKKYWDCLLWVIFHCIVATVGIIITIIAWQ